MKFAYARVSTRKQSRDGNGLEEQIAKLKNVGFDELVVEEFTGATTTLLSSNYLFNISSNS